MKTEAKFDGPSHHKTREDAIWLKNPARTFVPAVYGQGEDRDTKWANTLDEMFAAGGEMHFNEDQTEIVLTLPKGWKFSIKFGEHHQRKAT